MKIAILDPSIFTWPYDRALAGALHEAGHEVRIFGKRLPPEDYRAGDPLLHQHFYRSIARLEDNAPRPVVRTLKGVAHVAGMKRLADELARWSPDVIHFQWLPLPAVDRLALPWLRRIAPTVLTVHDTQPFNGIPGYALQTFGTLEAFKLFDHLIVHTDQGRRRVAPYAGAGVSRIPHGLLHDGPAPARAPRPAGGAEGECVLLMFGQIKPYKGVDLLIQAVADLPAIVRSRCRVQVVGKPLMEMEPLIALARDLGVADRFEFRLTFVPDEELSALFTEASAIVFPYREIEASGVLMTAISHTKPVIASRLGVFAELLEHERQGLLIPPDDIGALSAAIARLASEAGLQRRLAGAMVALKESIPSWAEIAEQTVNAYDMAARHHGAHLPRPARLRASRS